MTVISRRTKRWDRSGVSLGGIGAGKIEFCPSGRFSNLMTQNNWDAPVAATLPEQKPTYDAEGIPGAFLAAWVEGAGAVALKEKTREGIRGLKAGQIRYEGQFPRATVGYPRMAGVELSVEAFSSLDMLGGAKDHHKDSSLPAAIFVFRFRNASKKTRRAAAMMSWQNFVGSGGYADALISDRRKPKNERAKRGALEGIVFGSDVGKVDPRVDGQYVLATESSRSRTVTVCPGYDQSNSRAVMACGWLWERFNADGTVPAETDLPLPFWTNRASGAVAVRTTLKAGQSVEIPFALTWFFPHLVASGQPKVDYGHAYANWFSSAWDVAEYVLRERERLHAQTRAWQRMLEDSNLPAWLVEKLCDDLFSLFACSWYTKDYRHTVNESPTDMGGCHGTIDQRACACAAYEMSFPVLSRSELTLFAEQQVGAKHPDRVGMHWDMKKGRFGKRLDRAGAIRHDTGWDHIEGGGFGSALWQNIHWPDLTSVFALECLRYIRWSGDRAFLKWVWPRVKDALDFQERLDQNGDGVADLWGHGSNTYDSQDLHYYGASSFIASLYIAANIAAREMAGIMGDRAFAKTCDKRIRKARKTYKDVLWNERRGHFNSWVDTNHKAWKGTDREHGPLSDSSMIAQIAGQWFTNLLGLPTTVDRAKIDSTLARIYKLNVGLPKYCPAIDASHDGRHNYSWPQYAECYYAANAIYEGRADEGLRAVKKIRDAQYERDGSPWDTALRWAGEHNDEPHWGRWYMTNPASWFLLCALTGVGVDMLAGKLTVAPNIPKAIGEGKSLKAVPVFFPAFCATVDATVGKTSSRIRMKIVSLRDGRPVRFRALRLRAGDRLPKVKLNGKPLRIRASAESEGFIELTVGVKLAKIGDVVEIVG